MWFSLKSGVIVVFILGFLQLIIYFSLYSVGSMSIEIDNFILSYYLLFAFYVLALIFFRKKISVQGFSNGFSLRIGLFAFASLFRILMFFTKVSLSTDIFRYMWDGMLSGNGIDPYKYVPSSAELDRFKNVYYYQDYDHKDTPTIYPPFAQFFFMMVYLVFPNSVLGLKSFLSFFDLLNGFLVARILRKLGKDEACAYLGALIYLWNPLMIIEFSNSGHIDTLAVFLALLSFYFLLNSSFTASSAMMAASCLTKWNSLLVLPFYIKFFLEKRRPNLEKMLFLTIIFCLIMALPYILSSGPSFITSMFVFMKDWRFESALSRFFIFFIFTGGSEMQLIAKVLSYSVFILSFLAVLLFAKVSKVEDLAKNLVMGQTLLYLVVPATFPWYIIWALVFSCLAPMNTMNWLCISLSGTAVVTYIQGLYPLSNIQFWLLYLVLFIPIVGMIIHYLTNSATMKSFSRA